MRLCYLSLEELANLNSLGRRHRRVNISPSTINELETVGGRVLHEKEWLEKGQTSVIYVLT